MAGSAILVLTYLQLMEASRSAREDFNAIMGGVKRITKQRSAFGKGHQAPIQPRPRTPYDSALRL